MFDAKNVVLSNKILLVRDPVGRGTFMIMLWHDQ